MLLFILKNHTATLRLETLGVVYDHRQYLIAKLQKIFGMNALSYKKLESNHESLRRWLHFHTRSRR